ncbi:hypothetical protein JQ607_29565 [Bradyrhizobium liaoningense]|uniref:hypothetical protein n=1 Tax=Bradyrhizobium liaoningense TaxID=43992 RepID=UPI001BAD0FE0|nr:hypothetical protein [Bradyrhizobium liaoningense]MBR0844370.1 hypothetical protein [Bradyrhizobium liaoningense]MBR0857219.1 hypothetical protein [Bradyrhizobium liaoningense]
MIDLQGKLEQFEELAGECEQIAKLATDREKRELFRRVGGHYRELAADIKTAIMSSSRDRPISPGGKLSS